MIIFGKKRYEILPADSPLLIGKTFQKTDKLKFILGEDIMQGSILKAVIPAGGIVVTRNESHTICVENFAQKSEVYIALDERLWSIEFPEGTVVSEEARQSSGGSATPITLQDKTITENGTYTADEGYTGLGNVTVDVASGANIETCIVNINNSCDQDIKYSITTYDTKFNTIIGTSKAPAGPFGGAPSVYHLDAVKGTSVVFYDCVDAMFDVMDNSNVSAVYHDGDIVTVELQPQNNDIGVYIDIIYGGGVGV